MPDRRRRTRRRRTRRGASDGGQNIFEQVAGGGLTFAGNLFDDVRTAVMGLPMGVVNLAKDPIETAEAVGESIWQTWSPLFSGDFAKFGRQVYDHPLAPILDVASVFTLGAGTAARGASTLSKAGRPLEGSAKASKVASLRVPKAIEIADPDDKHLTQVFALSNRAGRRAVQEFRLAVEPHLPQVFARKLHKARFGRLHAQNMAYRQVAKMFNLHRFLEAGRYLSDDAPEAPRVRSTLAAHNYLNLLRHNRALPEEEARKHVATGHVNVIVAADQLNSQHTRRLSRLRRQEEKLDKVRSENAELAHAVERFEKELADANAELARMYSEGVRVATPASTTRRPTQNQHMEQEAAPVLDVERRVRDLEKQLAKARQAKGLHDDAVAKLGDIKAQRMDLEQRSFRDYFEQAGRSAEDFEKKMEDFGRWATYGLGDRAPSKRRLDTIMSRAARTKDGRVYVVPKHDAHNLGLEAKSSHAFVRAIWHNPTTLWKRLMIGWTPRSITNNFVGNWSIAALREGPAPEAAQALYDAIRFSKGEREAIETFRAAMPSNQEHWLYRYFGDELGNVFGRELLDEAAGAKTRAGRVFKSGLYPVVHKVADQPVRVFSIMAFLRKHPEVKRIMDEQGVDFDRAARQALRKNPVIREQTVQHVRSTAGDYATLKSWEKPIRDLVPFYLWYRHILRTGWNTTLETPGRLAIASRLSALGIESTEELLGEIPEFLEGAIPLSALGFHDDERGRKDILLTASLNPFASIGEISSLVEAFTTGTGTRGLGAAAMGLNPFATEAIEAITGRSLLSGAQVEPKGGLLSSVLYGVGEGLPQVNVPRRLFEEDTTETDAGNELLFARDDRGPLTSLFGIPLRDMSEGTAERLAQLEAGGKGAGGGTRRRRRRRR